MIARIVAAALGVWLMVAPAVLGYGGAAAASDRITGPVIAALAIVAMWDVMRGVRLAVLPVAAWLLVAPFVAGFETPAIANSVAVGLALIPASLAQGRTRARFGGGWRALVRDERAAPREG